jgi:hypothetical protein
MHGARQVLQGRRLQEGLGPRTDQAPADTEGEPVADRFRRLLTTGLRVRRVRLLQRYSARVPGKTVRTAEPR